MNHHIETQSAAGAVRSVSAPRGARAQRRDPAGPRCRTAEPPPEATDPHLDKQDVRDKGTPRPPAPHNAPLQRQDRSARQLSHTGTRLINSFLAAELRGFCSCSPE